MKHISKDEYIIEQGTIGLREEYVVGKGANLTLIIVACVTKNIVISPMVRLAGMGSTATILGAVYAAGDSQATITTLQHHHSPRTTSNLLIKCVMNDESTCRYEGSIVVDKKAQKTNAYQRNENLLIGVHAKATSKPALEILANDVRCTHGAVVKTLNSDELWYGASRGIGNEKMQALIVEGFLKSAFDSVTDTIKREEILWMVSSMLQK